MNKVFFLLLLLVFSTTVTAVNIFETFLSSVIGPVIQLINDLLGDEDTDPNCPSDCPLGSCSCSGTSCECLINLPEDPNPCHASCDGGCGIGEYCGCDSTGCNCSCTSAQCNDAIDCASGLFGEALTCCNGQCTDTTTSPSDCGACGRACSSGSLCLSGACVNVNCSGGLYACADVQGLLPLTEVACCPSGSLSYCVDVLNDPTNCGGCGSQGNVCDPGEVCVNGSCTTLGNGLCEPNSGENCANTADCACETQAPGTTCNTNPNSPGYGQCS